MQRTVGNNQIEVSTLEAHVSGIADLKHGSIVEFPRRRRIAGPFHERSRSVKPHGDEVLVVPDDLQGDQSDARADIQNDSAFDPQTQCSCGKFVFQLARVLSSTGFNKCLNVFGGRFQQGRAGGWDRRADATGCPSPVIRPPKWIAAASRVPA